MQACHPLDSLVVQVVRDIVSNLNSSVHLVSCMICHRRAFIHSNFMGVAQQGHGLNVRDEFGPRPNMATPSPTSTIGKWLSKKKRQPLQQLYLTPPNVVRRPVFPFPPAFPSARSKRSFGHKYD